MNRACRGSLIAALLLVSAIAVADIPSLTITAMDPAQPTTLPPGATLYLRVHYQSSQPLRMQAMGYRNGAQVDGYMVNPSPVYPAGEGDAVVWVAFRNSARLDQIRVNVYGQNWDRLTTLSQPVDIAWADSPDAAPPHQPAAWAATLSTAQQQQLSADAHRASSQPLTFRQQFVFTLVMWGLPAYLVLQILAIRFTPRGQRKLALLPLWLMVPTLLWSLAALAMGSNLWPLWLILLAPLADAYLLTYLARRWWTARLGT